MTTEAYTVTNFNATTVIQDHVNNIYAVWGDEGEDYYFFANTEVYYPLVLPIDDNHQTAYRRSHAENPLEKAMARLLINT